MKKIWAPWRSHSSMESGYKKWKCLFCGLWSSEEDCENLVLDRGEHSLTLMNLYPYNSGHLMVAPCRHTAEYETLTETEITEINKSIQKAIVILKKIYKPDGLNLGLNLGQAAGAGVADHLHYHIVPRWVGDTNFMPLIGKTKVVSVDLEESYEALKEEYDSYRRF